VKFSSEIGDSRGQELLTSGKTKPRNLKLSQGRSRSCAEGRVGEERTCGSGFHRDSIGNQRAASAQR
jgi:hypothetical protein